MTSYQGYKGLAHFPAAGQVRHVMSLYRGYIHYVASGRSDIRSFADITKRPYKVYIGKVGTLHHVLMTEMLKAHGITPDDIRKVGGIPNPVAYSDVVRMLQDGQLDVAMLTGPLTYSMGMELAHSPGVRLLNAAEEARAKVIQALPGIGRATIPKGTYKGQDEDIQTVAYMSHMVASSETVRRLRPPAHRGDGQAHAGHENPLRRRREIKIGTALVDNPIPVHPGAKRYYDEKGVK